MIGFLLPSIYEKDASAFEVKKMSVSKSILITVFLSAGLTLVLGSETFEEGLRSDGDGDLEARSSDVCSKIDPLSTDWHLYEEENRTAKRACAVATDHTASPVRIPWTVFQTETTDSGVNKCIAIPAKMVVGHR